MLTYFCSDSYGRVYTADPYHAALAPAAYGVGAMVSPERLPKCYSVYFSVKIKPPSDYSSEYIAASTLAFNELSLL